VIVARGVRIVDLRSPSEFADDHLPGALNVPLFDDSERALVGTLYKRSSPEAAFETGRALVVERVRSLVEELAVAAGRDLGEADLEERVLQMTEGGLEGMERGLMQRDAEPPEAGDLVLHCWRGGMRSSSVVALLQALGWSGVCGLRGGYKRYRSHVMGELSSWSEAPSFVLRGGTGVGKTLILREIERLRPGWTVDLELAAGHRSSILGMVGLEPCSQKLFDSRLARRLRERAAPCTVFEGESRKVGDVIIPAPMWEAMQGGVNIYLEASTEHRVEVLLEDYLASESSRDQLRRQLPFIEQRLGPKKWDGELVARLDDGREAELVELLLEHYYDPLYQHSEKGRSYDVTFSADDTQGVAAELVEWIERRLGALGAGN
jgi:tRNA 2-selenouridine synthase